MSTVPHGTVWKLVKQIERTAAKQEALVDDVLDIRTRVARLERQLWVGTGIIITLQVVFGLAN